jgi:hypothetical protein
MHGPTKPFFIQSLKYIQGVPKKPRTRINNYVFIKNEIALLYHCDSTLILFCFYLYCTQNMKSQRHRNIKFIIDKRM